jgi:hypothetical protein
VADSIKRQAQTVESFLDDEMLYDRKAMAFRSPLFSGLNDKIIDGSLYNHGAEIIKILHELRQTQERFSDLIVDCSDIESKVWTLDVLFSVLYVDTFIYAVQPTKTETA